MTARIPVLAATALDPGQGRVEMTLPEGLTLSEIVAAALPGLAAEAQARARVTLVTPAASALVLPEHWHRVRPRAGVRVVIRVVPGKDALRSVLSIVVSVAAFALGAGPLGLKVAGLLGVSGAVGSALVTLGVNLIGALLINALIPPVKPDDSRGRDPFVISGWKNPMNPNGTVPVVLGSLRHAPSFAAGSHTEIVGDLQYIRAMFTFGEGRVSIADLRIGETALAEFGDVEVEIREGLAGDDPCSLYPTQVVEENVGVELTRPLPRDDAGEIEDGPAIATPVVRTTGADAAQASIILAWPGGLVRINSKGQKEPRTVRILVERRLVTASVWTVVTTLNVTAKKAEGFYRQHRFAFPARGRWQVRLTMLTDENTSTQVQERTQWVALQTIRPEYPLAFPRPLALIAVRIKASFQLSGQLDNLSALVSRICLDWDHVTATWVERATSNPASLYRQVLQSPANPKAVADAGLDLAQLQDWHDFCRLRGLHYNRVLDAPGTTLRDALTEIAAAGRATPRHDGTRWGVVIDRPSSVIVEHVNPRNSWGFKVSRAYAEQPDALVIDFLDAGNDFRPAQRIVRRPGFTGDIVLTEQLSMPGLTDPETVWREGLRRFYEAEYRPDVFEATMESAVRVATRGDTLALSHDVLSRTQRAARIRSVAANVLELDDSVTMVAGTTYGLRFRTGVVEGSTIGTSVVRTVETLAGETTVLTLSGSGAEPVAGDLVHFGPLANESFLVVATGIETTEDQCSIIRAVAAAPEIDALTAAAVPPAWSSRVGVELEDSVLAPAAPRFVSVRSGVEGAGAANHIAWLASPGPDQIAPATYQLDHRPGTSGAFATVGLPAADGGGTITVYAVGNTVQLRLRGLSAAGVAGPWSPTVTVVVGAEDAPIPAALNTGDISVATRLGGAVVTIITPADPDLARLQIYRANTSTLDRASHAYGAPVIAEGARSYSLPVGDQTRVSLIANGDMGSATGWTVPADVTIAGGVATKVPGGAARHLTQGLALVAGELLRVAYRITSYAAGNARIRCLGTADADALVGTAPGAYRGTLTVPASPGAIGALLSSNADLAIDDVVAYRPTPACLPQGVQYLWIEPQNADGAPGPVAGPFTITID